MKLLKNIIALARDGMSLREYQELAGSTRLPSASASGNGDSLMPALGYAALALAGEAGEVANLVKKIYRDDGGDVSIKRDDIADEIGDVLWYVAAVADDLDLDLDSIAKLNLKKLVERYPNCPANDLIRNAVR